MKHVLRLLVGMMLALFFGVAGVGIVSAAQLPSHRIRWTVALIVVDLALSYSIGGDILESLER